MIHLTYRRMSLADLDAILPIERVSYRPAWTRKGFRRMLAMPHCDKWVALADGVLVGYWLHLKRPGKLELISFAVHPGQRQRGIGRQMFARIVARHLNPRRPMVTALVRETNLAGQLFCRACGFRAVDTLDDDCTAVAEPAYLFEYDTRPVKPWVNRIAHLMR